MTRSTKTNVAPKNVVEAAIERIDPKNLKGVHLGVGKVQDPTADRRFKSNANLPALTKSQRRAIRAARAEALARVAEVKKTTRTRRETRAAKAS